MFSKAKGLFRGQASRIAGLNHLSRRTLLDRSFRLANLTDLAVAQEHRSIIGREHYSIYASSDLHPRDMSKQLVVDLSHEQGYRRGHIRGAVNLSVESFDFTRKVDVYGGISQEEVYSTMKKIGVSDSTSEIILYDNSGMLAGRLWFVLRYFGFKNVRILNGGWRAWLKNGLPVDEDIVKPEAATSLTVRPKRTRYLTKPTTMVFDVEHKTSKYVDLRRTAAYNKVHIDTAVNIPASDFVEDGIFRPVDDLRKMCLSKGLDLENDKIIVYSSKGLSAAVGVFALELIGGERVSCYDAGIENWSQIFDTKLSIDAEDFLRH
jgi:thiosulfate/3-mercaptopyruvate sulfurtransferase